MDKADHICILFNSLEFTKIIQLWPFFIDIPTIFNTTI